ncbi:MAG: FG-GAP repeat protein [Planctomycetes bacterium]|nr:FG-GAP repeat protein [Planctomycetota bacterium]
MVESWVGCRRRLAPSALAGALCLALLSMGGCPNVTVVPGGGGTDGGTGGERPITGDIISVRTDRPISEKEPFLSILYTLNDVPTGSEISAFAQRVTGSAPNYTPIGERVTMQSDLTAGANQVFRFLPGNVGPGSYQVGLLVEPPTGTETVILSLGLIQVQGPPNPVFIRPAEAVTLVDLGETVAISFDAGDPEGNVQWRLFYLREGDSRTALPDQIGTQLGPPGSGNVGSFTFSTADLTPGDYQIGVAATDSGDSVAATASRGEYERIVTVVDGPIIRVQVPSDVIPPTIAVTAPGATNVNLFIDEPFTVRFTASVRQPGATGLIDVFYDDDRDPESRVTFAFDLPASTTSAAFPVGLPEGVYNVGAAISDGVSPTVFTYAQGTITVVRTSQLEVTAPNTRLSIAPSVPGEPPITVNVTWTTNVPSSAGTVDVFARTLDVNREPTGPEIPVLAPTSTATTSTQFSSTRSGVYLLFVRITFTSGQEQPLVASAPQPVRVTSVPRILWLGSLTGANPAFEGAIFGGVNFEDNLGGSLSPVADQNGDGNDEFLIAARYGKPFFSNPTGIGPGEAYLLYGAGGSDKLTGEYNLNSLGTGRLEGVTFAGVRTPQGNNQTDGVSSVSRLPDVDGDGKEELVFGFPMTKSRGHNVHPAQDGVKDPRSLSTLEREDQFLRGGIIVVSSRNGVLSNPSTASDGVDLDLVGQGFRVQGDTGNFFCVEENPDATNEDPAFALDVHTGLSVDPTRPSCQGGCGGAQTGGKPDATAALNFGFVSALARDYFSTYVYSFDYYGGGNFCTSSRQFQSHECLAIDPPVYHQYCSAIIDNCDPFSPGLHSRATDPDGPTDGLFGFPHVGRASGFYASVVPRGDSDVSVVAAEPLGARIIGVGLGDRFGTSFTLSNATGGGSGDIIISAPARTARGILLGPDRGPEGGGEISGLQSSDGSARTNANAGVAYLFSLRSLWTSDAAGRVPPRPHQYIVGEPSHCGGPLPLIPNITATRIAGATDDRITNVVGIDDFNADGRNDFAVGAPEANGGQGRVYVAFRREPSREGDYVLEKLALDPTDPERLAGVLITTGSVSALGASLVSGVDFNGDGLSDLVIGSPNASGGIGEVVVVFGDPNLISPAGGVSVETLLSTRNADGRPRAARITGNRLDAGGQFGFNLATAGDVDGDGKSDLLIAAPNATPRFDADPTDENDVLTAAGVDLDSNGTKDDVGGATGLPDGRVDDRDNLSSAGIVYVISSKNRLDQIRTCATSGRACSADSDCSDNEVCAAGNITISIDQLGRNQLRGFMILGRRSGDRIAGGDAGEKTQGGIDGKKSRGRSYGLSSAGDVDGDGRADILIGSVLADPRRDPNTGVGVQNGGEAYLVYATAAP